MSHSRFLLSDYQFNLPPELIAQEPLEERDSSRLMIVNRATGEIQERIFRDLVDILDSGDSLVFNNTKVIPARLLGKRSGGGKAEIFLIRPMGEKRWEALAKPGKKLLEGSIVTFSDDFSCKILKSQSEGIKYVEFIFEGDFDILLEKYGQIPLPSYIHRCPDASDRDRYQTIFAKEKGAVAAPTAGLHFTPTLLSKLESKGVKQTQITLHVGMGTFRPVQVEDIRYHKMHPEYYSISTEAAKALSNRSEYHRQICVGTTCCRALEASMAKGFIACGQYETDIFIYPGYHFNYVQALLTNFHLPGSSLLMLVSAFAGYDLLKEAYARAVKQRYRFFSYGDAMLIL